jgi:hypothetical protein
MDVNLNTFLLFMKKITMILLISYAAFTTLMIFAAFNAKVIVANPAYNGGVAAIASFLHLIFGVLLGTATADFLGLKLADINDAFREFRKPHSDVSENLKFIGSFVGVLPTGICHLIFWFW